MPAMAALLIMAGIQSIKIGEIRDVWEVGAGPRSVMLVTFACTLMVPVQWAVFIGVILSGLVYFFSAADDVHVLEIVHTESGQLRKQAPDEKLPSRSVTVLQIRGNLFYAAVEKLEAMLPSARQAEYPVVILSLYGQEEINSTFINLLERYNQQIEASRGKLMLASVGDHIKEQLDETEITEELFGEEDIFEETDILGQSMQAAYKAAQDWLENLPKEKKRQDN
jgi:SulP family sulfate permease